VCVGGGALLLCHQSNGYVVHCKILYIESTLLNIFELHVNSAPIKYFDKYQRSGVFKVFCVQLWVQSLNKDEVNRLVLNEAGGLSARRRPHAATDVF